MLSSAISIGYAVPNFALAFTAALTFLREDKTYIVLPFLVGFVFDLLGSSTVGAMALVCVLVTYVFSKFSISVSGLPLILICTFCFSATLCGEVLYGILLIISGADISILQAFIYRALPCAIYDGVIAVLICMVFRHLLRSASSKDEMNLIS
jgi:rod shape-determining protein MreD